MTERWDEETLAYAAGFIDGEGCFSVSKTGTQTITVANCHKPIIDWLNKTFGGVTPKPRPPRRPTHRPCHTWQISGTEAVRVCQAIAPYLKEKANQALLLIGIQQTKNLPLVGIKLDPVVRLERQHLTNLLKEAKHVAWA